MQEELERYYDDIAKLHKIFIPEFVQLLNNVDSEDDKIITEIKQFVSVFKIQNPLFYKYDNIWHNENFDKSEVLQLILTPKIGDKIK